MTPDLSGQSALATLLWPEGPDTENVANFPFPRNKNAGPFSTLIELGGTGQ